MLAISNAVSGYSLTLWVKYSPARWPWRYSTSPATVACSRASRARSRPVAAGAGVGGCRGRLVADIAGHGLRLVHRLIGGRLGLLHHLIGGRLDLIGGGLGLVHRLVRGGLGLFHHPALIDGGHAADGFPASLTLVAHRLFIHCLVPLDVIFQLKT